MIDQLLDFLLQFLTQFAGGPGAAENNLVRFALPAFLWGILLYVAWSRQRHEELPREKLLVWGFALGLVRELFMLSHVSLKLLNDSGHDALCNFIEPVEHALTLAAVVVIAGSFLRYILDDATLSGRYLRFGLGAAAIGCFVTVLWWPRQLAADPNIRFHETQSAWLFHLLTLAALAVAFVILISRRGWLRNVVLAAFVLLFSAEFLILINYVTDRAFANVLCPIGNGLHILAVPLFGYVYFREMSIENKQSQIALATYRDHLEELVADRTAKLTAATKRLEKAAVLEERQRFAAEMHDGLAQTLSYLGMKVDGAVELLQKGRVDSLFADFYQIQRAIGQASLDVRRSIATLQESPKPRRSLQEALEELIGGHPENGQVAIQLDYRLKASLFLPSDELDQALRVVQEALLNVHRHAKAHQAIVQVKVLENTVTIVVVDDGCGFDPEAQATAADDHFGLSIMKARAARIGGSLVIHSSPGQGTEVILAWQPKAATEVIGPDHGEPKDGQHATDREPLVL